MSRSKAQAIVHTSLEDTPFGTLHVYATDKGICSIDWDEEVGAHGAVLSKEDEDTFSATQVQTAHDIMDLCISELRSYFEGKSFHFTVPLDVHGSEFQQAVWEALRKIPYGQIRSYGDIANEIGKPAAVRAVGQANRANPVPVLIPCHRVLGKSGALTGYAGSQVHLKEHLLALESSLAHLSS